jgi:VWFA-related protein
MHRHRRACLPGRVHRSRRCLRRASAAGFLAALAAPATALQPSPAEGPIAALVESVDVEVVEVQAFVTDRDGRPVPGLTAADFRLRVDGEERPIVNFFEALDAAQEAAPLPGGAGSGSPPVEASPPTGPPPPARRGSLVVLLDELHLDPRQRLRTLERLAPLLRERLAAGDALLIASLDRSLRVVRPFDADHDLATDLAAIGGRAPGGVATDSHRRQTVAQIRDIHATQGCRGEALALMQALADGWTQTVEAETRQTLAAIESLLRSLAGREERGKALLLVTSGLPLDPGLEVRLLLDELCRTGRGGPQTGVASELAAVTRAATAAQITFYSLDAGGQRTLASALDAGGGLGLASQSEVRSNLQDPVFAIASDTGGRTLLESNQPETLLAELSRDLTSFYSLGFAPRPGDQGRAHRIAVEVTRPGLRVRHRRGWLPLSPEERLVAELLGRLRFGGAEENPLGARLESSTPRHEGDGTFSVDLRLRVPAAGLALVPAGDRRQGRLAVFLVVGDEAGRTTPVRRLPLPVDLAAGEAEDASLELRIRVGPGESRLALAVRDELAQQTSLLTRRLRAGPAR